MSFDLLMQRCMHFEGFPGPAAGIADPDIFCEGLPLPENRIPDIF
jgi:hypothetical protein